MIVQELFTPATLAAGSTTTLLSGVCSFGGFLCTTAGNFNLKDVSNVDIIPAIGVVVGQFVPCGFICGNGAKVVLSGGAAGVAYFGTVG